MWIITGAESLKGRLLNAARRFSLCAQTEEPPFYKYVSVEGPIVDVAPAELEADRRPLAHRYFGPELGDAYVASTDDGRQPQVLDASDSLVVRRLHEALLRADDEQLRSGGHDR